LSRQIDRKWLIDDWISTRCKRFPESESGKPPRSSSGSGQATVQNQLTSDR